MKLLLDKNIKLHKLLICIILLFNAITLHAEEIDPTDISYVSINPYTNEVSVCWYKSESANIKFARVLYIYDETTLIKGKGIADIQGNTDNTFTFKTDSIALFPFEANEQPISIAVDAYSENGNNSTSLREYHTTMVATARTTTCPSKIKLTWSSYYGYGITIDKYEIIEATNGENVIKQCSANENTCLIDLNENNERKFFIRATFTDCRGIKKTTTSSMCTIVAPQQKMPQFIDAENISIQNNDIELSFKFDTSSNFKHFILYKSEQTQNTFIGIDTINLHSGDSPIYNYTDIQAYKKDTINYYKAVVFDNCNEKIAESQTLTPIQVKSQQITERRNYIEWSANIPWNNVRTYHIWISENDEEEILADSVSGTINSYMDNLDNDISHCFSRCYRIEAIQDTIVNPHSSFSNQTCIENEYKILIPNAINPISSIEENRIFKPKYAFLTGDYKLEIYDRNGTCIFKSDNIDEGWNGTTKGKNAPIGMYQYQIHITLPNGEHIERHGLVHLIYK